MIRRWAGRRALVLVALACGALAPRTLSAQETPRSADLELRAFAATVLEIGTIRDEMAVRMAKPDNKTVERQAGLRRELQELTAQAITSHGLTQERYDHQQVLVTTDEEWRAEFERRLAAAKAAPRPGR